MSDSPAREITIIAIGFEPQDVFQLANALATATNAFASVAPGHGCMATVKSYNPEQTDSVRPATSFTATTECENDDLARRLGMAINNSFPAHRDYTISHTIPEEFRGKVPPTRSFGGNVTNTWVVGFTN